MIWREGPPPHLLFETFGQGQQHAVFTRLGGVSLPPYDALNLSPMVADAPDHVKENQRRAQAVLNYEPDAGGQLSAGAWQPRGPGDGPTMPGGCCPPPTAWSPTTPGLALTMRYADCVPVLLYGAARRAVGIAHAGWRGTVLGVAAATAQLMIAELGCDPAELVAGIGPSIGPCCYQVGPEVVAEFRRAFPGEPVVGAEDADGRAHVDLWRANAAQLAALGVTQIEQSGYCTCCHQELFFSHRGSGRPHGPFRGLYWSVGGALSYS